MKLAIYPVIALKNVAKRLDEVALVVEALVAKRLVAVALVNTDDEPLRLAKVPILPLSVEIVADATVSEEMVVVASVVVPVTVKRLDTVDVPAKRSTKLPLIVAKVLVKKLEVVALVIIALLAKKLVAVA